MLLLLIAMVFQGSVINFDDLKYKLLVETCVIISEPTVKMFSCYMQTLAVASLRTANRPKSVYLCSWMDPCRVNFVSVAKCLRIKENLDKKKLSR